MEPSETNDGRGRSFPLTAGLREVLTRQLEKTAELEQKVGSIILWLFQRNGKPIKDFRKAWTAACQRAGVTGKVPDDFRRKAVRNLERSGVSRSAAMMIGGHRSESIYRGMALADEVVLQESAAKLAVFHQSEKTGKRSRPLLSSPGENQTRRPETKLLGTSRDKKSNTR